MRQGAPAYMWGFLPRLRLMPWESGCLAVRAGSSAANADARVKGLLIVVIFIIQ